MTGRRGRSCPAGRLDQAAGRAQANLALETRVGSRVWITRTQGLIDRISTEAPAQRAGERAGSSIHAGLIDRVAGRGGYP